MKFIDFLRELYETSVTLPEETTTVEQPKDGGNPTPTEETTEETTTEETTVEQPIEETTTVEQPKDEDKPTPKVKVEEITVSEKKKESNSLDTFFLNI